MDRVSRKGEDIQNVESLNKNEYEVAEYKTKDDKESFLLSYENSIDDEVEYKQTIRKTTDRKSNKKKRTLWEKLFHKKEKNQEPQYEEYREVYCEVKTKGENEIVDDAQTVYVGKSALDRRYTLLELKRNKEIPHDIQSYPYTIGSKKDSVSLYLKDASVSRIHGKITNSDGNIYYEDMHSTNGSLINDMPILPHEKIRIKRGDLITIGKTEFEFR